MNRRAILGCQKRLVGLSRRAESSGHAYFRCRWFSTTLRNCNETAKALLYPEFKRLVEQMIGHNTQETKGWSHSYKRRGTERRLSATLRNATLRGPSAEKMTYDAGEAFSDGEGGEGRDISLSPGTFIETRR